MSSTVLYTSVHLSEVERESRFTDQIESLLYRDKKFRVHGSVYNHAQSIISALRGPDWEDRDDILKRGISVASAKLKVFTTARLRHVVCPDYDGDVNPYPLSEEQIKERNRLLSECPGHFSAHWMGAVGAVKALYNYDLENEKPV